MEHLKQGQYYRFDTEIYYVEKVYPDEKWGDRYTVRSIARFDARRLFIYKNVKSKHLADGLDGVTKATTNIRDFIVLIFKLDFDVVYVDV